MVFYHYGPGLQFDLSTPGLRNTPNKQDMTEGWLHRHSLCRKGTYFPSCPMQMQCLQKPLRETQGHTQVPGISHSSKRWKCQEFAALWECGLTEFPCSLYFQKCQAQDNAALETGQKGPNDCTEMTKNSLTWASLSDYQQLGYNLRINLFQGEGTQCLPLTSKLIPSMLCQGSGSHIAVGRDLTIGNTHFPLLLFLSKVTAFPGCGTWGTGM